jgi:hypothetical protein
VCKSNQYFDYSLWITKIFFWCAANTLLDSTNPLVCRQAMRTIFYSVTLHKRFLLLSFTQKGPMYIDSFYSIFEYAIAFINRCWHNSACQLSFLIIFLQYLRSSLNRVLNDYLLTNVLKDTLPYTHNHLICKQLYIASSATFVDFNLAIVAS